MRQCHICGSCNWIEQHEVFHAANRKASKAYGMTVDLCHYCHNEPPNGIHHNRENELTLKREFQARFEDEHGHDAFMQVFGKNYL